MKTIVVATDFSTGANRTVDFAIKMAHAQQAALAVVHAFHAWPTNPAETGIDAAFGSKALHDVCLRELNAVVQDLLERSGLNVPIRTVVQQGYTIPAVLDVVAREKADLLVMSTVGSAPQSAQLMGSVATAMISETTVPLLLIPPTATYTELKNVVLGIDLSIPTDAATLDTALRVASQFHCVVNLLCQYDQPVTAHIQTKAEHIRSLMRHIPHTLTILPGNDVYDTLINFAHTNKANLIMMLPQKHNWLRKLFVESTTEHTARLTDIPLLAIV
ncbi:universal stress protein [Fibrella forsythiae]|uniref:Universal stress protein n=1 Tax=Fibrella forsythiae TaxID=2817061 RepID=A0ABS3JJL0_9BACT|nr:universal stress protein [Fibrella forsythiae]MBO0949439.1 universal stress protein [Fibrella forsythiae]